jgi:protein gp37
MARTVPRQGQDPWTVVLHPDRLDTPLRWKKPRRIFVNSLSDLFHEDVPDDFIADVYAAMIAAWWHTYQLLTKRPERRRELLTDSHFRETVAGRAAGLINKLRDGRSYQGTVNLAAWHAEAARNIHEGVSVENQATADERIPILLQTPAAVRFISAEPLLGPIDLERGGFALHRPVTSPAGKRWPGLNWIIVGGESGPGARPCDLAWIGAIKGQCKEAGVSCFVKQLGTVPMLGMATWAEPNTVHLLNHKNHMRVPSDCVPLKLQDRKGGDWSEWPEDLRVREFPL